MDLKILSFRVVGDLKGGGWSSAYDFGSDLSSNSDKGRLFVVASSSLFDQRYNKLIFGREILSDLYNRYYNYSFKSNLYGLKNAVEETYSIYKSKFLELEIGAVSLAGGVLNSAVVGGAQTAIFRDKFLVKILVSSSSGAVYASGHPRDGDLFLLGTGAFFDCFESSDFDSFLNEVKDSGGRKLFLDEKAQSFVRSSKIAGVLICFGEQFLGFGNRINLEGMSTAFRITRRRKMGISKFFLAVKKNVLPTTRVSFNLPQRKIYIRSHLQDLEGLSLGKRKVFTAFSLIIFIFFLVFLGSRLKIVREEKAFYQSKLAEVLSGLDEAKKIAVLDPEKSRKLFFEAKSELSVLKDKKRGNKRLEVLENEIVQLQENILKEYHPETELFLDLSLLSSGFETSTLKADIDNLLVLDSGGKRLVKISFEGKRTEVVAGPEDFSDFQDIGIYADSIFVLTSKALFNIKDNKKELFRNDFGNDAEVNFYAGNAYVLDKNPSRIYRLTPTKEGFSLPVIWADEDAKINFAQARSWFIDGFVWVLVDDNQIFKFSRGVPEKVLLKGVYPEIQFIDSIYSNERSDFVYLLDSSEGRIVVINKDGNYVCQYVAEVLKDSKFLVVSESKKKAIFSSLRDKLYSIELRHL